MNKTIAANELRIGNWIIIDNKELPPYYYQVTAHDIEEIEGCGDDSFGIELTPEMLDKIGKRSSVFGDTRTYWIIGDFLYCEDDPVLNKGLHWLQNFHYFRTSEELTISLT